MIDVSYHNFSAFDQNVENLRCVKDALQNLLPLVPVRVPLCDVLAYVDGFTDNKYIGLLYRIKNASTVQTLHKIVR